MLTAHTVAFSVFIHATEISVENRANPTLADEKERAAPKAARRANVSAGMVVFYRSHLVFTSRLSRRKWMNRERPVYVSIGKRIPFAKSFGVYSDSTAYDLAGTSLK